MTGLLYTHSHVDHFGGARGVVAHGSESGLPVLAPEGFLGARGRRERLRGQRDAATVGVHVRLPAAEGPARPDRGTGLGAITSAGTVTLIAPTWDITRTGQEETVDGVRVGLPAHARDRGAGR